jgi:uncharacterized protein YbaR (Trm112 family)
MRRSRWLLVSQALLYSDGSRGNGGWTMGMERRMGIPEELLEILVCPICKTPVKLTPDNLGLKCETCRRVYPVRDDIPVMLPEEAKFVVE